MLKHRPIPPNPPPPPQATRLSLTAAASCPRVGVGTRQVSCTPFIAPSP